MYAKVKITWKSLREHTMKIIKKEKNDVINKRAAETIW